MDILDKINFISGFIAIFSGALGILVSSSSALTFTPEDKEWKSDMKVSLILGVICLIFLVLYIFTS